MKSFRVVRVETGETLIERTGARTGEVAMRFSSDGRYVTVRRGSGVELFDPRVARSVHAYDVARGWGRDTILKGWGRLAEVRYVQRTHALVKFDPDAPATVLGLWPHGVFRRLTFGTAPGVDEGGLRTGAFGRDGLISPSERWLFTTREVRPQRQVATVIDGFDLVNRRYVRSFGIPGTVGAVALSADERRLAIAVPTTGEIQVYDLWRNSLRPCVLIQVDPARAASLAFTAERDLMRASDHDENVRVMRLPEVCPRESPEVIISYDR